MAATYVSQIKKSQPAEYLSRFCVPKEAGLSGFPETGGGSDKTLEASARQREYSN